jgi:hypothetical protein
MQDLLVLGIVPGTNYVIPIYFWVIFGLVWILLFWNIDKIHLSRKLQTHAQLQSPSTSIATTSSSLVTATITRLVHIGRAALAKFVIGLTLTAHLAYQLIKEYVIWADKKANSVHPTDLKKIIPSKE